MFKRILLLAVLLGVLTGLGAVQAEQEPLLYTIEVDLSNQITTVYRASDHSIVRQMICSGGLKNYTPLGVFRLEAPRPDTDRVEWYYITKYRCFVKYVTRIKGPILFHSIPYAEKELSTIDREALAQLGEKASHGCIRLRTEDARWVAEHCPKGTVVRIYNSAARKEALRQVLLEESYTGDGGLTYREFLDTARSGENAFSIGRGATGETVSALQRRLAQLGLLKDSGATGRYDGATVVAVMRCQANYELAVNGVVSQGLMRLLDVEAPVAVLEADVAVPAAPEEEAQPTPLLPIPAAEELQPLLPIPAAEEPQPTPLLPIPAQS